MIEVEIKVKVRSPEEAQKVLEVEGFSLAAALNEVDRYYDNEEGRVVKRGEALRIRQVTDRISGEVTSAITYKGQKLDKVSVTRAEHETIVEDAEVMDSILACMGYQAVAPIVSKERLEFKKNRLTVCLDEVEGLGSFMELEKVIDEGESREAALAELEELLKLLGYSLADTTRTSYLSQLQENCSRVIE